MSKSKQFGLPLLLRSQSGFTLIEALISIVVLSIGLLGMAYLQTWGHKFGQESYNRSQATIIANEVIDKIRGNRFHKNRSELVGYTSAPSSDPQAQCTANINAGVTNTANDAACFYAQLANNLPGGSGSIVQADNIITITIGWNDRDLSRATPNNPTANACNGKRQLAQSFTWPAAPAGLCLQTQTWTVQLYERIAPKRG